MKNFMRKIREQHPIKDVALFIGGILTGSALSTLNNDDKVINKEDVFIKRNNEEKKDTSETPFDENKEV